MTLPTSLRIVSDLIALTCVLSAMELTVLPAGGEDFRVENRVFLGSNKEPASCSTTIFLEGTVFDYLEEPAEVIVFEKDAGRFVLLDPARRVRAELSTEQVAAFTERLQQSAAANEDPFLQFLAAPKFDERYDDSSAELTLTSTWMTYRALLAEVRDRTIARQYREFSDWYARLNTMLHPGSKPPFARLLLNAAMARRDAIPRLVHLTFTPTKTFPAKRTTMRSEHQLVRQVAAADLDRVAQTREFMRIFQPVDFQQYCRQP